LTKPTQPMYLFLLENTKRLQDFG